MQPRVQAGCSIRPAISELNLSSGFSGDNNLLQAHIWSLPGFSYGEVRKIRQGLQDGFSALSTMQDRMFAGPVSFRGSSYSALKRTIGLMAVRYIII
jgi:hypothetical protein